MADQNYTELKDRLTTLAQTAPKNSEFQNINTCNQAVSLVKASDIPDETKSTLVEAIQYAANPSGCYTVSNGIKAGLEALEAAIEDLATNTLPVLNLANFTNLVSDGSIFGVEFVKRTTGELRKMKCRLGVKKHLKGGTQAYDAKSKGLLPVFDMEAKGYRSIPVDAVQSLSVHGQKFSLGGAV